MPTAQVPLVSFSVGPMTASSILPDLLPLLRDEMVPTAPGSMSDLHASESISFFNMLESGLQR